MGFWKNKLNEKGLRTLTFWEAHNEMKKGAFIARRYDDNYKYSNREILHFDDAFGIVDNNTAIKNISFVELEADNWSIVNRDKLVPWNVEYTDEIFIEQVLNGERTLTKETESDLMQENKKLKEALKEATDALYFYAKKCNYSPDSSFDSEKGDVSQISVDNGRIARQSLIEVGKRKVSKIGLLVHFKDGSEKILKYEDDDERDEDLCRLEFNSDVEMVCLYPIDEEI